MRLNLGACWGRDKCHVQQLGRRICSGQSRAVIGGQSHRQNWVIILLGSMVVVAVSSHCGSVGSIPRRSQISSSLLP